MKKINVIVKEKTILELTEDALKGDIIDLEELTQVDTSYIDQVIESGKDTLKIGATAAGVGGAAALAYAKSPKAAQVMNNAKSKIAEGLSQVSFGGKNLKDMIKGTKIFEKISKLPTPAKVAIAVGAGVIALVAPLATLVSSQKAGYIEGKHEAK